MENEENQKQVFQRFPPPLEIAKRRDSHIPAAVAATAVEKWKSKGRIPTFPPRLLSSNTTRKEGSPERRLTPSFRLIVQLENAKPRQMNQELRIAGWGVRLGRVEVPH